MSTFEKAGAGTPGRGALRRSRWRDAHLHEECPWSSARSRILGEADPIVWKNCPIASAEETRDWRAFLESGLSGAQLERLRRHERTGHPLPLLDLVKRTGRLLGRDSVPKKPSRKPKGEGI